MVERIKNKKGFTLIELLATILIIGVIMIISIVGVSTYISKAEEKKIALSTSNLKETAIIYAKENYSNNDWYENYDNDKLVSCVSTKQLVSNGLIEKDKISNLGIEYIILNKNIENSVINSTDFIYSNDNLDDDDDDSTEQNFEYEVCKKTNLEVKYKGERRYTNALEIDFKFSLIDEETPNVTCKISSENSEIEDNAPKAGNVSGDIATCTFKNLKYKNNVGEKIKYKVNIVVEYPDTKGSSSKRNLELKPLTDPVILINGKKEEEKIYKREKKIDIQYKTENIHSSATITREYSFDNFNDINNIINVDDNIINDISITNNNKTIYAKISDGTNSLVVNKKVKYIDDIKYMCKIDIEYSHDKKTAELIAAVYDENNPNNNVSQNIKGYMWQGQEYVEFQKLKDTNPITTNTVYVPGDITVTLKNRIDEDVTCAANPNELVVVPPNISIELFKSSDNSKITNQDKWYNFNIYAVVKTTDNDATISYCDVNSQNGICTPNEQGVDEATVNVTSSGIKKIIATSKNSKGIVSNPIVAYIKVDKSKPNIPTGKVINSSGKDVTSEFDPTGSQTWKNYAVTFTDFYASDTGGSGIERYEYTGTTDGSTSCNNNTTVSPLNKSYNYNNGDNNYFCIRSVDKAGNASEWSKAYYFRIDTTPPTLNVSFNNSYSNNTWSNLANVTASATCSDSSSKCNSITYVTSGATTTSKTTGTSKKISNEGSTTITFSVTDKAGNSTSLTKYIKLDRTAPTFTFEGDGCHGDAIDKLSNVNIKDSIIVLKNYTKDIATTKGDPNHYCDKGADADKFQIINKKLTTSTTYETDVNILVRTRVKDNLSKMYSIALKATGNTIQETDFEDSINKCGNKTACSRYKNVLGKGSNTVQFKACDVAGNCAKTTTITINKSTSCKASNDDNGNCS